MKNLKITAILFLSSVFSLNLLAVPEGGFTTLMVQAKDICLLYTSDAADE